MPSVSVIIPSYNYAHFLAETLRSVLSQSLADTEIIVVDDGSTDNTAEIVERFGGKVTYVHQENAGLPAARNTGLRHAQGAFLQFLDADDLLGARALEQRADYLKSNPGKDAVICRTAFFSGERTPGPLFRRLREWQQPDAFQVGAALYHFNIGPPHAFLVRSQAVFDRQLTFDTGLRACEDYDFWFRLAAATSPPALVRNCWVFYRRHAQSMSQASSNQHTHDALMCRRILAHAEESGAIEDLVKVAAMHAAALVTTHRLLQSAPELAVEFFGSHVQRTQELLEQRLAPRDVLHPAACLYLARARVMTELLLQGGAIDRADLSRIRKALPDFPAHRPLGFGPAYKGLSLRSRVRLASFQCSIAHMQLRNQTGGR